MRPAAEHNEQSFDSRLQLLFGIYLHYQIALPQLYRNLSKIILNITVKISDCSNTYVVGCRGSPHPAHLLSMLPILDSEERIVHAGFNSPGEQPTQRSSFRRAPED